MQPEYAPWLFLTALLTGALLFHAQDKARNHWTVIAPMLITVICGSFGLVLGIICLVLNFFSDQETLALLVAWLFAGTSICSLIGTISSLLMRKPTKNLSHS